MQKRGIIFTVIIFLTVGFIFGYSFPYYHGKKQEQLRLENSYNNNGWLLYENRDFKGAIEEFERYAKSDASNFLAHHGAGWSYYYSKEPGKAAEQFESAIKLMPDDYRPYMGMGSIYTRSKQYDKAKEMWIMAIQLNPDDRVYRLHDGLGWVYYYSREYGNAIKTFNEAIQSGPFYLFPYIGLAMAYYEKGDMENADAFAKKAEGIFPYDDIKADRDYMAFTSCIKGLSYSIENVHRCGQLIWTEN